MTTGETPGEEGESGFMAALPIVMWQRRWLIIACVVLSTTAGVLAAYLIHPVYESSATILVEAQQVPDDLLDLQALTGKAANDAITQRIARARERVLSRQDLIRLIRQYNLYPEEQKTLPLSQIVDKMRDDSTIGALDSNDAASSKKKSISLTNTIVISVAFDYDNPLKAQQVAQQFVERFLEVDAGTQASQATDTVNFLTEQANVTASQVAALEAKILAIKSENGVVLAMSGSTGNQAADLSRIDSQIVTLQAENARLAESPAQETSSVATAEAQLRIAQAKYSDTHPDVISARAQLESARKAAAAAGGSNPIAAQIASNRTQLAALQRARAMVESQSSSAQSAQSRAPALNAQIEQLQKQADSLRAQSAGIGVKLQAAQIQQRMETEQKGERLTLADPPVVPDSPIKPNRPKLVLAGIAGGLALGFGIALLIELLRRPLRGVAAVRIALGAPPLAVVPDFNRKASWLARTIERRTRRKFARY